MSSPSLCFLNSTAALPTIVKIPYVISGGEALAQRAAGLGEVLRCAVDCGARGGEGFECLNAQAG
ncbi:hypothetical protein Ct61P_09731 [Colletotrichum tofieldiae]|nr:hypothetical protein Ct61P_09731 [Colletotrichum tofieldiae]